MDGLNDLESVKGHRADRAAEDAEIMALAVELWQGFTKDDRTLVRFGMFPYVKILAAEKRIDHIREHGRRLVVALMDCAKADGGMRA